mgnify:FL=1
MDNQKDMPDFLLEAVFNTMIDLTNKNLLKWCICTDVKNITYYTSDHAIKLNNFVNDSCSYISTLKIQYLFDGPNSECYFLKNITYPRGSISYLSSNWDKLYYNLVTAIIESIIRNGSNQYNIINFLASISKEPENVQYV